jgi:hypothetical protein
VIAPNNDGGFFCPVLVTFVPALPAVVIVVDPVDPDANGSSIFFALANELAVGANNLEPDLVKRCFVPRLSAPAFEFVCNLVPIDETPPLLVLAPEILPPGPIELNFTLDVGISDFALKVDPTIGAFCF